MIRISMFVIIFAGLAAELPAFQGSGGNIAGQISDSGTEQGLPSVHIRIPELERGAVTGPDGGFRIGGIPPGVYSVRISYTGYRTRTLTDLVVRPNRTQVIRLSLHPEVVRGEEVTVSSGYFHHREVHGVSTTEMNAEEIRRSPGSGGELARVMTSLAGVASMGDMSQDLIVRGGSPEENAFYIDNIYMPGIRHFETIEGASHGPIGLINSNLVQSLEFSAGGFSAAWGGHMSSVAEVRYREGSRERVQGTAELNMAGFGGSLETPLADGRGSVLVSARRSYLDLIADAINASGAPRYGDIQAKAVYEPDRDNRFTLLQLFGDSRLSTTTAEAREEGYPVYPRIHNYQNTTGVNWRRLWSRSLHSNTSASWSFRNRYLETFHTGAGEREHHFGSRIDTGVLRHVGYWQLSGRQSLEFGGDLTMTAAQFDYRYASVVDEANVEQPVFERDLRKDQLYGELFATWQMRPVPEFGFSIGSRAGTNSVNGEWTLSPRLSATWAPGNRWNFNIAGGIYRQPLPLFIRSQQPEFDELRDPKALHVVAGVEFMPEEATRITLEFYAKEYSNLPLQTEGHDGVPAYVFDTNAFYGELSDRGTGQSRGVDLVIRRRISGGFHGTVSASLFRSRYTDFRGEEQRREYDTGVLFSFLGGYRPSDKWEFSARWSLIGSRPYTPLDLQASSLHERTILDISRYHGEDLDPFHSLYLRADRRFFFDTFSIVTFFELWNAYDRSNVYDVYWDRNTGGTSYSRQFDFLPVGGFILEW